MTNDVKVCVDAKVNFFEQYFTVPAGVQGKLDEFIKDTNALGEQCDSATQFDEAFVNNGLSDKFNGLIAQCVPKAHKMTKEEKKESRRIGKQILKESDTNIVKNVIQDAVEIGSMKAEGEVIQKTRDKMIEEEVFDDYTRTMNFIDFLKRIFFNRK